MKNKRLIFLGMTTTSIFATTFALSSSCLRQSNIQTNTEILLTKSSSAILPSEITKNDIKVNLVANSKIKNIEMKADDKTGTLIVILTVEANGKEEKITKTFTNFKKQEQNNKPNKPKEPNKPEKPIEDEPTEPEKPGVGDDEEDPQNPGGGEEKPKPNDPGTGNTGGEDEEEPGAENPGQPRTPGNEEEPEKPGNPQPKQPINDTSLKGLAKAGKLFVVTYNSELDKAVKKIKANYAEKSYIIVNKKGIKYGATKKDAKKIKTFVKINEKATGDIKSIVIDTYNGGKKNNRKALQFSIENGKVVIKFKIIGDETVYTVALEK